MRFEEALSAMRDGKKVRCNGWPNRDYYLIIQEKKIIDNSGFIPSQEIIDYNLLLDDWEIFGEEKKQEVAADTTATLKSYEAKLLWEEIERLKNNSLDKVNGEPSQKCICVCHKMSSIKGCYICSCRGEKKTKTYWVNIFKNSSGYHTGEVRNRKEDCEHYHSDSKFVKMISLDIEVEE